MPLMDSKIKADINARGKQHKTFDAMTAQNNQRILLNDDIDYDDVIHLNKIWDLASNYRFPYMKNFPPEVKCEIINGQNINEGVLFMLKNQHLSPYVASIRRAKVESQNKKAIIALLTIGKLTTRGGVNGGWFSYTSNIIIEDKEIKGFITHQKMDTKTKLKTRKISECPEYENALPTISQSPEVAAALSAITTGNGGEFEHGLSLNEQTKLLKTLETLPKDRSLTFSKIQITRKSKFYEEEWIDDPRVYVVHDLQHESISRWINPFWAMNAISEIIGQRKNDLA